MAKGFNLNVALSANTKEYQKALSEASTYTGKFSKSVKKSGASMKGAFAGAGQIFSPIQGQLGGIASMGSRIGTVFSGLKPVFTSVKMALISTGIGAIVVAIGTAVAALSSYLSGTKEGAGIMKKALGGVKAVVSTLTKRLQLLGKAVWLAMSGHFKAAWETAKESVKGVTEEIKKNWKEGQKLGTREFELQKRKNDFIVKEAKLQNAIANLRAKANDAENYSATERLGFIKEAIKLQRKLGDEQMSIRKEEYEILKKKDAMGNNTLEDDKKEQELLRDMINADTQRANVTKTLLARQTSLTKESEKELAAKQDLETWAKETTALLKDAEMPEMKIKGKIVFGDEEKTMKEITSTLAESHTPKVKVEPELKTDNFFTQVDDMFSHYSKQIDKFEEASYYITEGLSAAFEAAKQRQLKAAGDNAKARERIEKKFAEKQKAIAISQAIINGALAITKVQAQTGIMAVLAYGMIIAQTAAQIATISAQKFATGGIVQGVKGGDRIPILASGGEMMLNQKQQKNLFDMINKGGKSAGGYPSTIKLVAEGTDLVAVIKNYEKQTSSF